MEYPDVNPTNRNQLFICPFCHKQLYLFALKKHLTYPSESFDTKCADELHSLNNFILPKIDED